MQLSAAPSVAAGLVPIRDGAVISGRSRAIFHGGILIAEGADGSDAQLETRNLLLTDKGDRRAASAGNPADGN